MAVEEDEIYGSGSLSRFLLISTVFGVVCLAAALLVFMPHAVNLFIIVPLFATQIYDVELTAGSLILCVINAVILSVAAPPIPGGAISCYTLMLLQLGVPLEAISLAAAANVVLDFTATGGNLYALLVQLTHGAKNLHMLDETVLYRPE